ncbi:MAG: class I SAM-dependent methyltransferase [Chitinophagales bacterium]
MSFIKDLYHFLNPKFQNLFLEYPVDMKPIYGHGKPAHKTLNAIISSRDEIYRKHLKSVSKYTDALHNIEEDAKKDDAKKPGWNNGYLPGLDIVAIYTLLGELKPKKYIEVGSGTSTKVARKAKDDLKLDMEIVSIDPNPRQEIGAVADTIIKKPFENTDYKEVLNLEAGDVLFIDNSHRILPNSDGMVFYMEILPFLKKGVIVHIHDIYLPYDYPQFMCDRFYSEQYGLAINLMANPKRYQTIFPCYYISENKSLASELNYFWKHPNLNTVEKHGGSFWLEIGTEPI